MRADVLRTMPSQLVADVTLYTTQNGGKRIPALPGWGCPCVVSRVASRSEPIVGYDGWPLLNSPFRPGDRRRLGFVFLSGEEAAWILKAAGRFYLWEGRFVGEAVVVPEAVD